MKNIKRYALLFLVLILSLSVLIGCGGDEPEKVDGSDRKELILSTTTSTEDSGLLGYLLPIFTEETGIEVKTVAVGTGKALENGRAGDADVLLVHAKAAEEEFVKEGHGLRRSDVMYNDFVLVGPADDPAKLKEDSGDNILRSLETLADSETLFLSRGDDSGTHKKELQIWEEAGIKPEGEWYLEAGQGMADTLKIASEKEAYTITDRATFLKMQDELDLEILVEGDDNLFNQYGIIPVNPDKNEFINGGAAEKFEKWMLSEEVQELIGKFGIEEYGQALFVPNAK